VILGMSVQARDGAGERELAAVAEMAADSWEAAVARASGAQPS
jgi:hypothetical protein